VDRCRRRCLDVGTARRWNQRFGRQMERRGRSLAEPTEANANRVVASW
jgi:hypothetical protein